MRQMCGEQREDVIVVVGVFKLSINGITTQTLIGGKNILAS